MADRTTEEVTYLSHSHVFAGSVFNVPDWETEETIIYDGGDLEETNSSDTLED